MIRLRKFFLDCRPETQRTVSNRAPRRRTPPRMLPWAVGAEPTPPFALFRELSSEGDSLLREMLQSKGEIGWLDANLDVEVGDSTLDDYLARGRFEVAARTTGCGTSPEHELDAIDAGRPRRQSRLSIRIE